MIRSGNKKTGKRRAPAAGCGRFVSRGAATVEMAVVTPLLLLIMLGTIQFGYLFMVQETLTNATREACRVGVLQGSTAQDIQDRFYEAVAPIGLDQSDVSLMVQDATDTDPVVTVRVQLPFAKINLFGNWLGLNTNRNIGSTCSMRKEGTS